MIQGIFYISKHSIKVLIDPRSIHSFILYMFTQCLKIKLIPLNCILMVSTLANHVLYADVVYKSCLMKL